MQTFIILVPCQFNQSRSSSSSSPNRGVGGGRPFKFWKKNIREESMNAFGAFHIERKSLLMRQNTKKGLVLNQCCIDPFTISSSSSSSADAAMDLAGDVIWKNGSFPFSLLILPVRLIEKRGKKNGGGGLEIEEGKKKSRDEHPHI